MPKYYKIPYKSFFLEIFRNPINLLKRICALGHLYMAVSQWSKYMSTKNLLSRRLRETGMCCPDWWQLSTGRFEVMYFV